MGFQSVETVMARAEFAGVALIPESDWSSLVVVKVKCSSPANEG
jgi:hypothetical protein